MITATVTRVEPGGRLWVKRPGIPAELGPLPAVAGRTTYRAGDRVLVAELEHDELIVVGAIGG